MTRRAGSLVAAVLAAALGACSASERDAAPVDVEPTLRISFVDSPPYTFPPEERAAVEEVAAAAVAELRVLLPDLEPQLRVEVHAGSTVIPETGEVGAAITPQLVRWIVDPSAAGGVAQVARTQLRSTLFHELHHTVRGHVFSSRDAPDRFVDLAISEGMASVFERDAAGDRAVLWAQYPDDVDTWVRELLALPVDADTGPWLYEHPDGRRWIGYRAGAFLVDRAMAASGRSAAELVRVDPAEILELAGYGEEGDERPSGRPGAMDVAGAAQPVPARKDVTPRPFAPCTGCDRAIRPGPRPPGGRSAARRRAHRARRVRRALRPAG